MIPARMQALLKDNLPETVLEKRIIKDGDLRYLEFGPTDVESLQGLGIIVDRLGPRLVSCMWIEDSPVEIGGFLVVDNLAMGQPSMGGVRMLPGVTPHDIHNLARGMTLKNAAADLPFGGGKSGIVKPDSMNEQERDAIITGFGRLIKRYTKIYIPGPDVGTNDADMKTFAIGNGMNNCVSKTADMGGNRIDELGGAANGVVVATKALLEHLPKLKKLPQFRDMVIPEPHEVDVLIQGFGAVGAHAARIFHDYDPENAPIIKGISDVDGYLLKEDGLPWEELFELWKQFGSVTEKFYHEHVLHKDAADRGKYIFSNCSNNLLTESAFCMVPASPVFNYLDIDASSSPSMTVDRMGQWRMIVEGANSYSPLPAKKAARRKMERYVYRDRGVLIAADYLVNSGGVIYAAHERIVPTPEHLEIPTEILGNREAVDQWLDAGKDEFAKLSEERRKAAVQKLENVIRRNMEELVDGLCRDADSLPCEIAEKISIERIARMEKSKTVRDIMEQAPTIEVDKSIAQAAELLVSSHVSIVNIVSEKGKLIGIVTEWDITRAMASRFSMDDPLTKIMTADVVTTAPDASVIECIRILETNEISAIPVVEDDKVVGVISGDMLVKRTLFRLLQTRD